MVPARNIPKTILVSILMFVGKPLIAIDLPLTLDVSGTISAPPSWQNIFGNDLSGLIFFFSSNRAGIASRNVDSTSHTVALSDPSVSDGASISFSVVTPSNCSIGDSAVSDSDVSLVVNSVQRSNSALVAVAEESQIEIKVRFISDGNYGDKSGSVVCTTPGALTYTY